MDFTLNEDQQALQETVRKFAVSELPEIALEIEKTAAPASHDLIKRYAEMGFLGDERRNQWRYGCR